MLHKNLTPFHFGAKVTSREPPQVAMTLFVRGTFVLRPNEALAAVEDPLEQGFMTGDVFDEEDVERTGALRYASDFGDYKPKTDVLLKATCYPPGGSAVTDCPVQVGVGGWSKSLLVTGSRVWKPRMIGGAAISEPAPFEKMPIVYENAFGGPEYAANPVGKGVGTEELPNVEDPGRPVRSARDRQPPAGFGPISPEWPLRLEKRGVKYGKSYRKTRAPFYAEDFDWTYFNAAPDDQQLPEFLRGDEELLFQNLHPTTPLWQATLPGLRIRAFAKGVDERFREVPMHLDTLYADLDAGLLYLTWRGLEAIDDIDMADVSVVLIASEALDEEPKSLPHYAAILDEFEADPVGLKDHFPDGFLEHCKKLQAGEVPDVMPGDEDLDPLSAYIKAKMGPVLPDQQKGLLAMIAQAREAGGPTFDELAAKAVAAAKAAPPRPPIAVPKAGELPQLPIGPVIQKVAALKQALVAKGIDHPNLAKLDELVNNPAIAKLDRSYRPPDPDQEAEPFPGAPGGPPLADSATPAEPESFVGRDLTGRDFSGRDLTGADFSGANLTEANLENANLTRATLAGATLAGAKMTIANLFGADLREADMTGADLSMAMLESVSAENAVFTDAVLEMASVTRARLPGAVLRGVKGSHGRFAQSDLQGIDARGADFERGEFDDADLTGADFSEATLVQASLRGVRAHNAVFRRADLTNAAMCAGADFTGASFVKASAVTAIWQKSVLTGADFSYADLKDCHLQEARATGARFFACDLKNAAFRKATLDRAEFVQANLCNADLNHTTLVEAQFVEANCYNTKFLEAVMDGCDFTRANLAAVMRSES